MSNFIELPKPIIKQRTLDPNIEQLGLEQGLHPLLARILAARPLPEGMPLQEMLTSSLSCLESPYKIADMEKAASRLATAIINKEYIGIETDHDCDGQTSHAVLYYTLHQHFKHPISHILSYIGHRLTEGYGLTEPVAQRILQAKPRATLLITADNGSSDEPRIKQLSDAGIDVIVTDHHEVPISGHPASAYACLNPMRSDCNYEDKCIAGCMVAWLLMAVTRQQLITKGYLVKEAPKLLDSLDFVAVGTVADCVSIGRSKNNRAVVAYGLKRIAAGKRPCWRVVRPLINGEIIAEDLSFRIGPLLNSDGRLSSAFKSVSFLLSATDEEAQKWVVQLQQQNQQRKEIQRGITSQGLKQAVEQVNKKRFALIIFLEDGHVGVHGISASRIKEYFGRPTVFFAPRREEPQIISGSIRGIEGFHVREALQFVADADGQLLIAFGGHQGAGGVTLLREDLNIFAKLFEQAAQTQLNQANLGPVIWTDGELPAEWINLNVLELLGELEPFGREFEVPLFQAEAKLLDLRTVGDGLHARVVLNIAGKICQGIWFSMRQSATAPMAVDIGDCVMVAYSLKLNEFQGIRKCEIQVSTMYRI